MSMSVAEFRANLQKTLNVLSATGVSNESSHQGIDGCSHCHVPLQETVTGCRKIEGSYVCSDCYFDELGKEIDKMGAIGLFRSVRGA